MCCVITWANYRLLCLDDRVQVIDYTLCFWMIVLGGLSSPALQFSTWDQTEGCNRKPERPR